MKRLKSIFNSLRTLNRDPESAIADAWDRIKSDAGISINATDDDRYLIEQIVLAAGDEAVTWKRKLGEQSKKGASAT